MGKKQEVLSALFAECKSKGTFVFDNGWVKDFCKQKGFGNPFDATKLDDTTKLPQELIDEDMFVVHLGDGKHQFVKGIKFGYHEFEEIPEDSVFQWEYRKSILNEFERQPYAQPQ